MAKTNTSLTFTTTNQSLWGPGFAYGFNIDSGTSLIYDSGEKTSEIDIDAGLFGVTGTAYVRFKIGLFAYASLGNTGGFDSTFNIDVRVDAPAAVKTEVGGSVAHFDFSDWSVISADLNSVGFNGSPKAGLDFIIDVEAGIRDGNVFYPFGDNDFDLTLIDQELTIPILAFDAQNLKISFTLFDEAVTITGQLPTGANTQASNTGELVISASGHSEVDFVTLEADLDALLVKLIEKIPGAGQVAKVLGEIVFAEHEFDLHDYIAFIPENKFVLAATLLDVSAYAGIHLTEETAVDITGADANEARPDVKIKLVSDNGTPLDLLDDKTYYTELGGSVDVTTPVQAPGRPAPPLIGTMNVSAVYSLENVTFDHAVGLGINASLTISALMAELRGDWVPDFLDFSVGPLLEVTFPEGGFQAQLFNFYNPDPFLLQPNAFNTVSKNYEVFYTNVAPVGWNPDAPGAAQAVYEFTQRLAANLTSSISTFGQLWNNAASQDVQFFTAHNTPPASGTTNDTRFWFGNVNASITLSEAAGANNFTIIDVHDSGVAPQNSLTVDLGTTTQINPMGPRLLNSFVFYDGFDSDFAAMLVALGNGNAKSLYYKYGGQTFATANGVEIQGNNSGDVLVYMKNDNGGPTFFDGGGQQSNTYDRFVANFLGSHPNVAINWDLQSAVQNGTFVQLANGVRVKNVEALSIVTGNQNDVITTYVHQDRVETSAGNDIVINVLDEFGDVIKLGDGDDIVVQGQLDTVRTDVIHGGRGYDTALHTAGNLGLRLNILSDNSFLFNSNLGLGADATLLDLAGLIDSYIAGFTNGSTVERTQRDDTGDNANDALLFYNGAALTGATRYAASMEAIGVTGSNAANDLVLFTGGLFNSGGNGASSMGDTLIGDFSTYETLLGVDNGLFLVADGSASTFGDSVIVGFERFAIIASTFTDYVSGGALTDFVFGQQGNDVLYGGQDNAIDALFGGSGEDTFYWYNNGSDVIDGDQGAYGASGAARDYLIVAGGTTDANDVYTQTATAGLRYDFRTSFGPLTGLDGQPGADRGLHPYYEAGMQFSALLEAMALAQPVGSIRAMSFTSFGQEFFMAYRNIDSVNIKGSSFNDLLIYEDGSLYDGRESAGDRDTFVADFSADIVSMDLRLADNDATGVKLANGVTLKGIDAAVIKGGSGFDIFFGASGNDYFDGGAGGDRFHGGRGQNEFHGGAGDDTAYWNVDSFDTIDGGADFDRLVVATTSAQLGFNVVAPAGSYGILNGNELTANFGLFLSYLSAATSTALVSPAINSIAVELHYSNIEHVDVLAADSTSDFIVYQGGMIYSGGEAAGAIDVFAGDFSAITDDLVFDIGYVGAPIDVGSGVLLPNFSDIGNGTLIGGFERFALKLGSGNDYVVGGVNGDYVDGGAGDDYLEAGGAGSIFIGGLGDDTLIYGGGVVTLDGGEGYDRINIETPIPMLQVEFLDQNNNQIALSNGFLTLSDAKNIYDNILPLATTFHFQPDANLGVRVVNPEEIKFTGTAGAELLISGSQKGLLIGDAGDDMFISRGGIDVMVGGVGNDRYAFDQGMGLDVIAGEGFQGGSLFFVDHVSTDVSFTTQGNNLIINAIGGSVTVIDYFAAGGNGFDFTFNFTNFSGKLNLAGLGAPGGGNAAFGAPVVGTAGDDNLAAGGVTREQVSGGRGDDLMRGSLGSDVFDGGAGNDTVSYLDLVDGVAIDLLFHQGYANGAQGDVYLSVENIAGGQGSNVLRGDTWANTLIGGNLGDFIEGRPGDDLLMGLGGNDEIRGDQGNDRVFGDGGDDTLYGNDGNDQIAGSDGLDVAYGGEGNDTIDGGAGNDFLYGEGGDDTMVYGGDDDAATVGVFEDGLDRFEGGLGIDGADFSRFKSAIFANLNSVNNAIRTRDNTDVDIVSGALRAITRLVDVENVTGTNFNDRLQGNTGANGLDGGAGDDILTGGNGSDVLLGGAGIDTVDYSAEGGAGSVNVDLSADMEVTAVSDTFGAIDFWRSIENVIGTSQADQFFMNFADNKVFGGAGGEFIDGKGGNDVIVGGADGDIMFGEAGFDILSYEGSNAGVTVNLATFAASGGHAENDLFGEFEGLRGSSFVDHLTGDNGNNVLDGGAAADTMIGGEGNDSYYTDQIGDIIDEAGLATDVDTVFASFTYTLGLTIENLTLIGTAVINGTGNRSNNVLVGNSAGNALDGFRGEDAMQGGLGDDIYYVDNAGDTVVEGRNAGNDMVFSSVRFTLGDNVENLTLTTTASVLAIGNALNNTITGNAGNNGIIGGVGADIMAGGLGDDTYYVDNTGDQVIEGGNAGLDTVMSSVDFTLDVKVENLTLTGSANINGTGSRVGNTLTGNDGNNVLDGLQGADIMAGGLGDDTYYVDQAGDQVLEASVGGVDRVISAIDYTLDVKLENLTLSGAGNLSAAGSRLANTIIGNRGNNTINGDLGNDTLTGGQGGDTFVFSTRLNEMTNVDTITDFSVPNDTIQLARSVFTKIALGPMAQTAFQTGTAAADAADRIIYNAADGALSYDSDGTGATAAVQFATLGANLALTHADFLVV